MEYISTRNSSKIFSFKDVFLQGLAPDGGLFVPKKVPFFSSSELENLKNLSYNDLTTTIISKFYADEFTKNEIKELVNSSYNNFRVENVVKIKNLKDISLLELFHGPTLAFKDLAMQVIGNMYDKILKKNNLKVNVVVATSGDTGAAAISAIKDRKNMKIFVLHPKNKISEIQRKFMTTVNSKNVFNIAIDSNFDECQRFVKLMFADKAFCNEINMSGVNSINWARIIIQIVYYFFSYFKIAENNKTINFSVPTGNFGDIYAGYIPKKMGLPIDKLIIATNDNDILKRVIKTGIYKPLKVKHTVSPSMDIQVASNFERLIFDIYSQDSDKTLKLMRNLKEFGVIKLEKKHLDIINETFCADSLTDGETKKIISEIYKNQNVLIDPHTAVAIGVTKKILPKGKTIVLSTAHPSKFPSIVLNATNKNPELPSGLEKILTDEEKYQTMPKNIEKVKSYILEKVNLKT